MCMPFRQYMLLYMCCFPLLEPYFGSQNVIMYNSVYAKDVKHLVLTFILLNLL